MKIVNESSHQDMSLAGIRQRLAALRGKSPNGPSGLPVKPVNANNTNPLYPLEHNGPGDRRWDPGSMITGSGNGPEFGTSSSA
jgi:hypothetical protein